MNLVRLFVFVILNGEFSYANFKLYFRKIRKYLKEQDEYSN